MEDENFSKQGQCVSGWYSLELINSKRTVLFLLGEKIEERVWDAKDYIACGADWKEESSKRVCIYEYMPWAMPLSNVYAFLGCLYAWNVKDEKVDHSADSLTGEWRIMKMWAGGCLGLERFDSIELNMNVVQRNFGTESSTVDFYCISKDSTSSECTEKVGRLSKMSSGCAYGVCTNFL